MKKKIPMRMCIVCKQMMPKKELVRIVKNENGVQVDYSGKVNGRGAYVCTSKECAEKLYKTKALNRAFSCEIDENTYALVKEALISGK